MVSFSQYDEDVILNYVLLEATKPGTEMPAHDEWEHILTENDYIFARQYGINRIYVAKERPSIIDRFIDTRSMKKRLSVKCVTV